MIFQGLAVYISEPKIRKNKWTSDICRDGQKFCRSKMYYHKHSAYSLSGISIAWFDIHESCICFCHEHKNKGSLQHSSLYRMYGFFKPLQFRIFKQDVPLAYRCFIEHTCTYRTYRFIFLQVSLLSSLRNDTDSCHWHECAETKKNDGTKNVHKCFQTHCK
jgi:hypothetical protein